MRPSYLLATLFTTLAASTVPALSADCDITVGLVMELTGPAGEYGQAGAKSVEMAFRDINDAGGVGGCKVVADTRDSQSQGNVAVDQATQLVNIKKVPVIIGGIISSVSIPILTSVTAPAGVVQVSPASSSPTLTALGRDGKTNGVFFRTITSDALQGTAAAKYAIDQGLKKIAIVNVNNDFGVNMVREFKTAYEKLGGTITTTTPYNEKQSSYASEASAAMAGEPDALYLVSTPVDGATIARAWISGGGKQTFLLNDGMNSKDFIESVGAQYLENAYGTSSGTSPTASTEYFNANYEAFSGGIAPSAPAADRSYDAGAIVGLAIAKAGKSDAAAIKTAMREVVAEGGTPIHAGKQEFVKALALIKEGKPVKYEGVIGPVSFDQYGDITGPFRLWKITNGEVTTVGELSAEDVGKLKDGK
ncbi:branched-chain amino acid transport system substrate-binding protein [Rhizobium sp. PP-F2F-G38]|uniref:ABC transporter substrate-binding protein n=1 Tax=Ferranicluibacter rubi TaxID=2715133 RepID=A0AA44CBJ7_9HYPH|nr:ABC transporter substrate-binding protein [Ferranicluibacter rubi]PYE34121.1 branched-chain amino acid transport system substrate-binding protein [Rhizobium sp. PP-WC-1G-195]PYE96757.1 branched-chain amino acid transport system substrate-binding protein [Rhizobium sp. PP-F2F-G38]TCP86169.1 branched-chain amino acid transport system substrate-binding protein [Rhizobium sp. PP-CC-2G-626]TCQ23558.1 branched-chain amino acid transport system substrate-binding protein [Rhizobium sp. PP-CC-3G-465]